ALRELAPSAGFFFSALCASNTMGSALTASPRVPFPFLHVSVFPFKELCDRRRIAAGENEYITPEV
ncbi:MAG: hypothetical protein IJ257_08850, partial [Treponema sp.]|nr:hypothetical protein [Treponema sp.]